MPFLANFQNLAVVKYLYTQLFMLRTSVLKRSYVNFIKQCSNWNKYTLFTRTSQNYFCWSYWQHQSAHLGQNSKFATIGYKNVRVRVTIHGSEKFCQTILRIKQFVLLSIYLCLKLVAWHCMMLPLLHVSSKSLPIYAMMTLMIIVAHFDIRMFGSAIRIFSKMVTNILYCSAKLITALELQRSSYFLRMLLRYHLSHSTASRDPNAWDCSLNLSIYIKTNIRDKLFLLWIRAV